MSTTLTSVRLKQELKESLKNLAKSSGLSNNNLINQALREYLDRIKFDNDRIGSWNDGVKQHLEQTNCYEDEKVIIKKRTPPKNTVKLTPDAKKTLERISKNELQDELVSLSENSDDQVYGEIDIPRYINKVLKGEAIIRTPKKKISAADVTSHLHPGCFCILLTDYFESIDFKDPWIKTPDDKASKYTRFLMVDDGAYQSSLVQNIYSGTTAESESLRSYCDLIQFQAGADQVYQDQLEYFFQSDARFLVTVDIGAASNERVDVGSREFLYRLIEHEKTVIFLESGGDILKQWVNEKKTNHRMRSRTKIPLVYSIKTDHRSLIQTFNQTIDFINKKERGLEKVAFFSIMPNIPLISNKIIAYQWLFKELINASHVRQFNHEACQKRYPDKDIEKADEIMLENISNTLTCVARRLIGIFPIWTETFKPDLDKEIQQEHKVFLKRLLSSDEKSLAIIFCGNDEMALSVWEYIKFLMESTPEDHWQRHLLLVGYDGINAFRKICLEHECAITASASFSRMREEIQEIVNQHRLDQEEIIYFRAKPG